MRISVYITSFNQKGYLKDAIDSVLNQTLKPFEIVIADDCSSDGSQELIKSYAKKYDFIKYIFHEKNLGVSRVRINALSQIKGDFVTYVDGDDVYLPHKLETEARLLGSGNFDLSFSNNLYVNPDNVNDVEWIWASNVHDLPKPGNMFIETLTRNFPRGNLFRMELVNTNLFKKTGLHDENLKIFEDYDLRIRLSRIAKINYSIEPTTKIRISKNGLSKSNQSLQYESFKYIFDKYNHLIEDLPEETKFFVKMRIQLLVDQMNPVKQVLAPTLKEKIKNKLIHLLSRV